jgi:Domain of unknown function (DUF5069)
MNGTLNHASNLTQRPPDSPRLRPGGYVVLARILDKGRAEIAGTAGEYKYNNPDRPSLVPVYRLKCRSIEGRTRHGKR